MAGEGDVYSVGLGLVFSGMVLRCSDGMGGRQGRLLDFAFCEVEGGVGGDSGLVSKGRRDEHSGLCCECNY